jgi:hypothetical protein
MQEMIADRKRRVQIAQRKGYTRQRWFDDLRTWYKKHGWTKKSKITDKTLYDPYAMLRFYRERYKQQNPDYAGVWRKRERDIRKLERKLKKSKEVAY